MIECKREGRRTYILGTPYAAKDRLKAAGAHWDPDKRAWWLGSDATARELAEQLEQTVPSSSDSQVERLDENAREIIGRGTYQGRSCYVIGRVVARGRSRYDRDEIGPVKTRDGAKLKLASRDGSRVFWASTADVTVDKRYERLTSIASLREYAQKAKENGGYVPQYGRDYCGSICPVGGHRCTADNPCHDCQ